MHSLFKYTGTLNKIDYMVGQKASFNKFKKTKNMQGMLSSYNGVKLQINSRHLGNSQICRNTTPK